LERNPQAKNEPFGARGRGSSKSTLPQVTRHEHFTAQNFDRQFPLTGEL